MINQPTHYSFKDHWDAEGNARSLEQGLSGPIASPRGKQTEEPILDHLKIDFGPLSQKRRTVSISAASAQSHSTLADSTGGSQRHFRDDHDNSLEEVKAPECVCNESMPFQPRYCPVHKEDRLISDFQVRKMLD